MITPRDFDLSPYFEIVKFNHLASAKFDYRRIEWASDEAPPRAVTVGAAAPDDGRTPKVSAA